jgi:hypothetical protein
MATRPDHQGSNAPQHFIPPTARELRAQALHRLQVGLLGLAAMLLLVGLASIIMERARMADSAAPAPAGGASAEASPKSDPLADIGVIPSPEAADPASPAPTR